MELNAEKCIEEYNKELYEQSNPYEMWIRENENANLVDKNLLASEIEEIVIFYEKDGELSQDANKAFIDYFSCNRDVSLVYADEDLIKEGKRIEPWFKPEFSPDTIKSINYFGSVLAVKKMALVNILNSGYFKDDDRYNFILNEINREGNGQIIRLSFDFPNYSAYWTLIKKLVIEYKTGHIDKILYHGYKEETFSNFVTHNLYELSKNVSLSIIIPSKDNPEILANCLASIEKYGANSCIKKEIIVVDNGSSDENKAKVEDLQKRFGFIYIYQPMDFNFSKMCNIGAAKAESEVLLFLNDDITIETDKWDEIFVGQALQKNTGAVGAKLYYPESCVIQHVGITNMGIGPAHKLAGIDDKFGTDSVVSIYHGRNTADYNVYAVTAAALCVTKEKFDLVNGFDERLSVAYNDVNLCFDLFEKGLFNIVRNDLVLYHHESISRGKDEKPEKKARLLKERKILYSNHPEALGSDPFYSKHLVQYRYDGEYNIGYLYPHEISSILSTVEKIEKPVDTSNIFMRKVLRKGPVCQMNIDLVTRTERDTIYNGDNSIVTIEGWAALTDLDECMYSRHLLLAEEKGNSAYKISVFNKKRDDVAAVMPMQNYNELLGFACHIAGKSIKTGNYIPGIVFTNRLNGKTVVYYIIGENVKPIVIY